MSGGTSFDEMDEDSKASPLANRAPIWSLDLEDKQKTGDVLKWLNAEVEFLKDENKPRFAQIERNIALWRGIQYWSQDKAQKTNETEKPQTNRNNSAVQKIVLNHLFDLTLQRAARIIEFKPAISVVPQSDSWDDKISSKSVEKFTEHIQYTNKFDTEIVPPMAIWSRVTGEMFSFVLWDAEVGKEHPELEKATKEGKKIPILDDNDKETGKFYEPGVKTGDVVMELEDPFNVLLQRRTNKVWKDVEYGFRRKVYTAEEIALRWPQHAADFKGKGEALQVFDFDTMEIKTVQNAVVIWFFYHKHTLGLKKGREIVFHKGKVLDSRPLRYNHGRLPFTRLRDICGPLELHGRSFYDNVKGGVGAYNNVTNLLLRNALLVAHPKWMLPAGSAKIESLGNAATVVQYRGPREPKLVSAQAASPELFTLRKELKQDFEQISQVYGVSRGAPPPGVDAAIAMQFLEEQENKASAPDQIEYNGWMENTFELAISTAGQFYDDSDKRTMMILGRNQRWTMKYVKQADLAKDYSVRVKSASALPKGRAARMQSLVYLQTNYPDLVPREMVLEMMDLAQNQKFIDTATVAVRAAEEENERMLSGQDCNEPQKWEFLIAHWNVHSKQIQETSFSYDTPENVRQAMLDHLEATEMLMMDKAAQNPGFAQEVMALPNFPLVFAVPAPDPMAVDAAAGAEAGGSMPPADAGQMTDQGESQAQEMSSEPGAPVRPKGGTGIPNMKQSPAIKTP